MAVTIKTKKDIETLREGGRRHAFILDALCKLVGAGVSALYLEECARKMITESGDSASFLGFKPYGANRPYPAALCVSVNDEVVHGIPNEEKKILKEGDIVSLDLGLKHGGLFTDMAITVPVGNIDQKSKELLLVAQKALERGIAVATVGNRIGDISDAIQSYVMPFGFSIVEELAGHGVGYKVHEAPYVPNYGKKGTGEVLRSGMVIAIEPMINCGTKEVILDPDGYTIRTKDAKRSAHFEHTVLISDDGPEILTRL